MMTVERSQVGRDFGLPWVLLSAVGWFIGFFMGHFLVGLLGELIRIGGALGDVLGYGFLYAVLGAGVGIMQWLVLQRQVSRAGWWVLASTVGLALTGAGGLAMAASAGYSEDLSAGPAALAGWTVFAAVGGAMAGIMQWPVLRGQVSRAGWWVLASTVGWALGLAVEGAGVQVLGGSQQAVCGVLMVSTLGGGAVLGAVTGGALIWLLRQPVPES